MYEGVYERVRKGITLSFCSLPRSHCDFSLPLCLPSMLRPAPLSLYIYIHPPIIRLALSLHLHDENFFLKHTDDATFQMVLLRYLPQSKSDVGNMVSPFTVNDDWPPGPSLPISLSPFDRPQSIIISLFHLIHSPPYIVTRTEARPCDVRVCV